jgi:hypothetical protein
VVTGVETCALPIDQAPSLLRRRQAAPCFTVSGEKASVHNVFNDGKPQVVELDMPSISTMASRGSESRNMLFTKIKRDDKRNEALRPSPAWGRASAFSRVRTDLSTIGN